MTTRTLHTVPISDGHLAYVDEGAGAPVVLLHGGVLDHRMWEPQIGRLAEEFRVIVPDLRGHGRSSTPTAPFRHGEDVAMLLRTLGTGPATLVGISLGAGTATDVALDHPDVVDGMLISGAGTSVPDFRDPWMLEMFDDWAAAEAARDAERWLETFLRLGFGPHRSLSDVDSDLVDRIRAIALDTLTAHVPDGPPVRPTPGDRPLERVASLTIPVRAVVGLLDSADHIRMPREVAGAAGREVAGAAGREVAGAAGREVAGAAGGDVVEIPDAAHYPNLEQPPLFDDALLSFLRR